MFSAVVPGFVSLSVGLSIYSDSIELTLLCLEYKG